VRRLHGSGTLHDHDALLRDCIFNGAALFQSLIGDNAMQFWNDGAGYIQGRRLGSTRSKAREIECVDHAPKTILGERSFWQNELQFHE